MEVVEFCKARALDAELVGRWIWVTFESKPPAEIRQELKDFGFRWSPRRGRWAHNCGYPSRRGVGDPRLKYGAVPISSLTTDDVREGV